jgi:hypothetical protein
VSDLATRTLLRAIQHVEPGTEVTADLCRAEFDAAQLNTADRGGAFRSASTLGYLTGTDRVVRSTIESRKNSANRVWIRTAKPIPDHVCQVVAS